MPTLPADRPLLGLVRNGAPARLGFQPYIYVSTLSPTVPSAGTRDHVRSTWWDARFSAKWRLGGESQLPIFLFSWKLSDPCKPRIIRTSDVLWFLVPHSCLTSDPAATETPEPLVGECGNLRELTERK